MGKQEAKTAVFDRLKKIKLPLYIEKLHKIRNKDEYHLILRTDDDLVGGHLDEIEKAFDAHATVSPTSEWEGCCEICVTQVAYLEIDLGVVSLP